MANVVKYYARVTMKSDTKTNWDKATSFIPLKGEVIHYSDLNKIKIGDGTTTVGSLKFIAENEIADLDKNTISPIEEKLNNAVLFVEQTLSVEQQEQARQNIGLFSSSNSDTIVDIKVKEATIADQAGNAEEADHAETADAAILAATAETAGQSDKLTCGDVGSATQPVYFDDGVPVAIGNSLGTAAYKADTYFATATSLNTLDNKLTTFLGTNTETLSQVKALITAAEESTEIAALVTKIDALIERVAALEAKDHSVSYGTGAPSGGSVGDVYIRI